MNHNHHNIGTTITTTDLRFRAQATQPQAENRAEEPRKLPDLGFRAQATQPQAENRAEEPRKLPVLRRRLQLRRGLLKRR